MNDNKEIIRHLQKAPEEFTKAAALNVRKQEGAILNMLMFSLIHLIKDFDTQA